MQLDGSKSTDVDGDPLTYSWNLITLPPASKATLSNPLIVNPTFTADVPGTYIVQLIVNDGVDNSSPAATVTITTTSVLAPVANAGPSDQKITRGATVTLNGSGTDPQGLTLTFHWALILTPMSSTAVLSDANIATPTFVADLPGTYIAQLIFNNGTLSSGPSTVTISSTDTAPVASAGPNQTVVTGNTVTLDGSGSNDSEHDVLTYAWSLLSVAPGSSATLLSPNIVSPTFVADAPGTYVAQLIVTDPFGMSSAPATVTITATSNSITLSPSPLNLANVPGTLTITLPSNAGAGGQVVNLAVLDTTVATAPQSVTIPANSFSTTATITPVKQGSTFLLASAAGFKPVEITINVAQPSLSITLDAMTIGVSKTATGTITLSGPAPPGGVNVTLSVNNPGIVTIPGNVNIASGTTGTFTVTGAGPGVATITAAAAGYTGGSVGITVGLLGAITLQNNLTVGAGQTLPFGVSLVSAAPINGVTVTLTSGDTTKLTVTPSVFIPGGQTSPTTPAQVTGVSSGSATITASAIGFTGANTTVKVAANLSFQPAILTLGVGTTQNVTLSLSQAVPAAVVVTLSSDTPGVASVPPTVTIPPNTMTVNVPFTGVAAGGPATITATSNVANIVGATAKVSVVSGVAITTATLPAGIVGVPYSAAVTATGGTTPYTFSATGLPGGLSISAAGQITGTPTTAGVITPTITVTDSTNPTHLSASVNIAIAINPGLSITTPSLPAGVVGAAYTASVTATGGTAPYTFSATGLPANLTISAGGQITGTPTTAGASTAVITVTDSTGGTHLTKTASLPLTINPGLAISTTSLSSGAVGVPYTMSVTATGGTAPYTFSATGLPANLTINATGQITGTPIAAGTSTVVITVTDSTIGTHLTKTASLPLTIGAALVITTASLPTGVAGAPYTASVTASGGTTPYTFSATGLPANLTISAAGLITGTPTTAGTTPVVVTVTDSTTGTHLTATASLPLTINPGLAITTTSLPNGIAGAPYSASVAASGGTARFSFCVTGLPAKLTISAGGQITGTPAAGGVSTVVITVTDSTIGTHLTKTASLSLTIGPAFLFITPSLPNGVAGAPYTTSVTASGGTAPYTFSATGLPANLTISAGGQITGTPAAAGVSTVVITVTDSTIGTHLTVTASLSLTINPGLAITTASLPNGVAGAPYTASVTASGGTAPYTFSATGLPANLTISAAGQITGTPAAAGASTVVVTVTDSTIGTHLTKTASLPLTIVAGLAITTASLPNGIAGAPYNASVAATGGTAPYTFSATGLPANLTISAGGQITGTPAAGGVSTVVITVTDSTIGTPLTKSASLPLTIGAGLVFTTASLPNGVAGAPYTASVTASGGTAPYTFSATGLPANLTISAGGQITGTPAAAGTSTVVITVTDSTIGTPLTKTASLPLYHRGGLGDYYRIAANRRGGCSIYYACNCERRHSSLYVQCHRFAGESDDQCRRADHGNTGGGGRQHGSDHCHRFDESDAFDEDRQSAAYHPSVPVDHHDDHVARGHYRRRVQR